MADAGLAERLMVRERTIVLFALVAIAVAAGAFIVAGGGTGMSTLGMTLRTGPAGALLAETPDMVQPMIWSLPYFAIIVVMWWLMMVAMMVPVAAPVVLLFAALQSRQRPRAAMEFLCGYLVIWGAFSLAVSALQMLLAAVGAVSGMYMNLTSLWAAAALLLIAGLYQLTPLRAACLAHCRGPTETLVKFRKPGRLGAFRAGIGHGAYCVGCCWGLMVLLFVGGVMNLWWIVGLTVYVALEKLSPWGARLAPVSGVLLIVFAVALGWRAMAT